MTDREPLPFNEEAEQALLGTLMARPSAVDEVDALQAHHFFIPAHSRIYRAIRELRDQRKDTSPWLVVSQAGADVDPDLQGVGGRQYIADLVDSIVSVMSAGAYADTIIELWRRRQAIGIIDSFRSALALDGLADRRPVSEQLAGLINGLDRVAEIDPDDPGPVPIADAGERLLQNVSDVLGGAAPPVLSVGLPTFDSALRGGLRNDLIVLGGRPGMGKTSFAEGVSFNIASIGKRVAFFSQEMTKEKLFAKQIAAMTGIPSARIMAATVDKGREFPRLVAAHEEIRDLPIFIDEASGVTPDQILRRSRRIERRGGLDLVIVDHLGMMMDDGGNARSQYERVSANIAGLQRVQKRLGVPVIVLVQLNREVEKRPDKRPTMADFRDTGMIEEYARTILLAYREEYYVQRAKPAWSSESYDADMPAWEDQMRAVKGKGEIILAKNDLGAAGFAIELGFDAERTRWHAPNNPLRDFDAPETQVETL
ncbi:MAG: DnaB-like helicase C-terminal domain-containing protein [Pseudomonadota bacterium]